MHKELCEICGKRPAEVEFVEIVDGKKVVMHLCKICANRKANGLPLLLTEEIEEDSALVCPNCGTSLSQIKQTLQVGCPVCYDTFRGAIKDLLKKLQGSASFSAQIDLKTSEEKDLIVMKYRLKKELDEAVKNEDFERAAKLRDEIENIDKRLKWLGTNPIE